MNILRKIRSLVSPSVEVTPMPFLQKIQFCSMGLMNGFGDHDHCYLPSEVQPGSLAVICARHIDEALRLGAVETAVV